MKPTLLAAVALAGCTGSGAPELAGLDDQIAVVGSELRIDLDATDPEGDNLIYRFLAPEAIHRIEDRASLSIAPSGAGVFRWTPIGADLGTHMFDFSVSDGETEVVETIRIDVVTSLTAPIFRAPLGTGAALDVARQRCIVLDVIVEDTDTREVSLRELEPKIEGAKLARVDGQHATWTWCPQSVASFAGDRYVLSLGADDRDNPETVKDYVIVLR
jgi:hypothetical protein